ncbi:hypothetical protein BpsM61_00006 [Bacillus phage vB_BpsM-61]|nr:hypothetical protein BpsM61_00006 [Bacillus phage vB_BpsM-61]
MFSKKIVTVPRDEFMNGTWREKEAERKKEKINDVITKGAMVLTGGAIASGPGHVHAFSVEGAVANKIMQSFEPVIQLVQGVSYPVAFLMLSGGFILIMTGQTSRGMSMIKWACLGYLGLQLAPGLMAIVIDVGESIRGQM